MPACPLITSLDFVSMYVAFSVTKVSVRQSARLDTGKGVYLANKKIVLLLGN
jgi:hypothetical protein